MQPLSRNGTQQSLSQKQRTSVETKSGLRTTSIGEPSSDAASTNAKDKKKGVSFLSRILGPNKSKNRSDGAFDETDGSSVDIRPEGMDAQLFSHSTDNIGFNPRHPQPPGYIKVRTKYKKEPTFDRIFLAQEVRRGRPRSNVSQGNLDRLKDQGSASSSTAALEGTAPRRMSTDTANDAIWAMEFSHDGKFLAAAGQDKIVRVWCVISSREERRAHEREEESASGRPEGENQRLSAPVFRRNPLREYEGHTSTVLDLSWSKNNFLLSSSFDKTVRLWHVSRAECLVTFKHAEYCPSICFHPRDDRFFLAGSLDTKLRLWSIPDKSVAFWNQLSEIITAVSFSPDGKTAIAGTMGGSCLFYETEGLKYKTQINIKPSGRNAKPAKITGIKTINWAEDNSGANTPNLGSGSNAFSPANSIKHDVKVLISSNDSRIRLYNFRDKSLEMKFKSHKNVASQIRASFSDDSRFVISGSEDRKTYLWSTGPIQEGEKQRALELFEAHNSMTTGAVLAPRKTRAVLSASEDPVFDICNPPPVRLVSRSESMRTESNVSGVAAAQGVPEKDSDLAGMAVHPDVPQSKAPVTTTSPERAQHADRTDRAVESPAYLTRTGHPGGHIIVTADYFGNIKVFRQDCAYGKRKGDLWNDNASVFSRQSRRVTGSISGGSRIGRSLTGASRGSGAGSHNSSRSRAGSVTTQPPGERILSWRQDVSGTGSVSTGSFDSSSLALRAKAFRANRDRSSSPRKSFGTGSGSTNALSRAEGSGGTSLHTAQSGNTITHNSPSLSLTTPTPTSPRAHGSSFSSSGGHTPTPHSPVGSIGANLQMVASPEQMGTSEQESKAVQQSPAGSKDDDDDPGDNPLWLKNGRSYIFWNTSNHTGQHDKNANRPGKSSGRDSRAGGAGHLSPSQAGTPGMELTQQASMVSRLSSERSTSTSDVSEVGDKGHASGELKCVKCGSTSFRARVVQGKEHRLVCQRCGTAT